MYSTYTHTKYYPRSEVQFVGHSTAIYAKRLSTSEHKKQVFFHVLKI